MHVRTRRITTTVVAVMSAALIAVGCGDDDGNGSSSDASDGASMAQDDSAMDGGDSLVSSPGVDLRYTLGRLLGEHAALALVALNKTMAGEEDASAVLTALEGNTDDLTGAIESVYGDDAGEAFNELWTEHIGFFAEYATATAEGDAPGQRAAKDKLAGYQAEFAKFLSDAAGLDAQAASAALGMHVDQLTRSMDQFQAGDYEASYESAREGYAHMYGTATALAGAISEQMPDEYGMGDVSKAAADTRVLLGQQLGEHAFLAVTALQKTMAGAKDAGQAVEALEGNTVDLGATIESVYGEDAERQFLAMWRNHIGLFVDYATAAVGDDEDAQDEAREGLDGYAEGFDAFVAGATESDEGSFEPALQEHIEQLIGAIDAVDEGDAEEAWSLEREAYAHMFMTADALSGAILAQQAGS